MNSNFQICIIISFIRFAYACRWKCRVDCRFPYYLQTFGDGELWLMRSVSNLSFQVTVKGNEMLATECRLKNNRQGEQCKQIKSVCRKRFADDKFLVEIKDQLEEPPILFRCMQFFKRSNRVVQIKSSVFLKVENETLCSDRLLYTDVSPMIRTKAEQRAEENSSREHIPCPIHGAYDLEIYSVNLTTYIHLKSDCMPERGMTFFCDDDDCLRKFSGLGGKDNSIEFSCLATWKDELTGIPYSVVKRNDMNTDFWCLFIEQGGGDLFQIIMSRTVCRHEGNGYGYHDEDLHSSAKESNESCPAFPDTVINKPANTGCNFYNTLAILMLCSMFSSV